MLTASSLRPLWERAAEWECRLGMIREATAFLYLSTFYIEYDRYGVELLAALLDAQRRGVAVNLLVDSFGQLLGGALMTSQSRTALGAQLDALRDAGAVVTTYRPEHYLQRRLGGGQHVKIQVSEVGEAIFGSSNVTRSSFEEWNEYSVLLRGPSCTPFSRATGISGGRSTTAISADWRMSPATDRHQRHRSSSSTGAATLTSFRVDWARSRGVVTTWSLTK